MIRTDRQSVVLNNSTAFSGKPSQYAEVKEVTADSLKTYKEINITNNEGIYAVRFSPQKDILAVGFGNGTIKDNDTDQELYKLASPSDKSAPILSIRFHPHRDSRMFYAAGPLGSIYMSRLRTQTFQCVVTENNQTMAMDINSIGDRLVTAGTDLKIRFYDPKTLQIINMYDCDDMNKDKISGGNDGHTLRIQSCKFHPQHPDMLITGGWDKMIKVWDRRFAKGLVKTIIGPYIFGDGIDVRDKTIATASWLPRDSLQLWDLHSSQLIANLPISLTPLQAEHLYFCQFCTHHPECQLLIAGGSGTKNIQAIDTINKEIVGMIQFSGSVTTCHTTGNIIAAGSTTGLLKLIRIQHGRSLTRMSKAVRGSGRRRSTQASVSKSSVLSIAGVSRSSTNISKSKTMLELLNENKDMTK